MHDSQTTGNHRLIAYTALPLMNDVALPESQTPARSIDSRPNVARL
jgi:hypothetical protein